MRVLIGMLLSFGMLCVLWTAVGCLLSGGRGTVICLGEPCRAVLLARRLELLREKNIEFRVGPQIITGAGVKRKREILDRLTKYRKTHGQGCFASLEGAQGVNATLMRGLLTGLTKADMQTWEAVDKALDKLEGGHG